MIKRVIQVAVVIPAFAAGLLMGVSPAVATTASEPTVPSVDVQAEKCGAFLGDGIRVRQAPRLNAPVNGYGYRSDCVLYNESTRGDLADCGARSTDVWTRVEILDSPVTGWVADCWLRR